MSSDKLDRIYDDEQQLYGALRSLSPEHRIAFTAGMAERWLHVYEAFLEAEDWGNPAEFREMLEAVWKHLQGETLTRSDLSRCLAQVEEYTPHMDDFDDAEAAMAACVMLGEALQCCRTADNSAPAIQAVISGSQAVAPGWGMDDEDEPSRTQQNAVDKEFKTQKKLIELVEAVPQFDDASIQTLRKQLASKPFRGQITPATEPDKGPAALTNQTAFEKYRAIMETDLERTQHPWWESVEHETGSYMWAMMVSSEWGARYSRRQSILNGTYGQLADQTGHAALREMQQARDRADTAVPDWGSEMDGLLEMTFQNSHNGYDATTFNQPHSYGPSLRRLWNQAVQSNEPDQEPWQSIMTWAKHRSPAWESEDKRKKKRLTYPTAELGEPLSRPLTWDKTDDPECPWTAEADGQRWQVRLNDFPDEIMYSLLIDGQEVGDFHDWPESWSR